MENDVRVINEMVKRESAFVDRILREVSNVIVGQSYMVERVLVGLLTGGHILLEGVPGLAKTLTVNTISDTIHAHFQRLQFTPDLLPADLIGTMIYDPRTQTFNVKKGPIFANLVLADEINRAPAKVQSAMLEAMQEKQVTIGETTFKLPDPFVVMATQNPIEQEGTYPLPEAQVDRFMLKLKVGYPTKEEELVIMERMTSGQAVFAEKVVTPEEILRARDVVNQVYLDDKIKQYIVDIVFATRYPEQYGLGKLKDYISYGASPRASIYLNKAARAHAFLKHRGYVIPEDIKSVGLDILRHRVILTYEAEAEELKSEDVIQQIFDRVEVP
jgi:MoxR-like ATPase